MFDPDVMHFRQFYSSPLGKRVRVDLNAAVRRFWPECQGYDVVGIGFTLPVLRLLLDQASRVISCMPATQGAIYWPNDSKNHTVLVHETALPLEDNSVSRVIVLHALEHAQHANTVLRELWRVLKPGGRVLLIVPGRRGFWSRAASSPFGCGQPYSWQQLRHRTSLAGFTFVQMQTALYYPPIEHHLLLPVYATMEWLGRIFLPGMGGVVVMEAEKQIYAAIPEKVTDKAGVLAPQQSTAAFGITSSRSSVR